jgi:hypothetical protein
MSPTNSSRVHFVKTDLSRTWPDIGLLDESSVEQPEVALRLRGGTNSWLVQTYLQLSKALPERGVECTIGENFVHGAVNIAHRDTLSRFRRAYLHCFVIGLRADRPPLMMCDFEILQNEIEPDGQYHSGIPLWPQPGIIPRDSAREINIQRIAYFGRTGTTATWFQGADFIARLGELGVTFEVREDRWNDYSDVDLILAHRLEAPVMLRQKPPSKLINAWLAGTPALLGDEPAFVNLRRSSLDYISVENPEQVLAAVTRLKNEPGLYQAMVANGQVRSHDYSARALRKRWVELLTTRILPEYQSWPESKRLSGWGALVRAYLRQRSKTRQFRARYALERQKFTGQRQLGSSLGS